VAGVRRSLFHPICEHFCGAVKTTPTPARRKTGLNCHIRVDHVHMSSPSRQGLSFAWLSKKLRSRLLVFDLQAANLELSWRCNTYPHCGGQSCPNKVAFRATRNAHRLRKAFCNVQKAEWSRENCTARALLISKERAVAERRGTKRTTRRRNEVELAVRKATIKRLAESYRQYSRKSITLSCWRHVERLQPTRPVQIPSKRTSGFLAIPWLAGLVSNKGDSRAHVCGRYFTSASRVSAMNSCLTQGRLTGSGTSSPVTKVPESARVKLKVRTTS